MAELTVEDLVGTYIKLSKDAPVYASPYDAEAKRNVWFTKKSGEVGGKLYSWIDAANPHYGSPWGKGVFLMFKSNDDFDYGQSYYIRVNKGLINWAFTKEELIKKRQADMNFFQKFVDDLERSLQEYEDGVVANVKSGLITGGIIVAAVLAFNFIIIPEIKFRRTKRLVMTAAREINKR